MPTREADRSFSSLLAAYLEQLRSRRYSEHTQRQAEGVLLRFFCHLRFLGLHDLREPGEADIVSFMRTLGAVSLGTRRNYLGVLRGFFGFLVRRQWLLRSPADELALPSHHPLPRRVPSEDRLRLLLRRGPSWRFTAERDRAILEVLYGSGLRRGECARLDLPDVDLFEGTLFVRNGKGRKDRVVPLTSRAVSALGAYLRQNRPQLASDPRERAVFLSERGGRRLAVSSLSRMVRKAAQAVGLSLSPHGLRHACATHLLSGGAHVRAVQELLGHAHLSTTALYTKVEIGDLKDVLSRAHPRERDRRRQR